MTTTIIAIITLIIGLVLGIFIKKSETDSLLKEKNNYIQKNNELNAEIQKLNSEIASDKTKLEMLAQLKEMVEKDFTAIANKVIKEEQSDLREQNREALEEKIKPSTRKIWAASGSFIPFSFKKCSRARLRTAWGSFFRDGTSGSTAKSTACSRAASSSRSR